MRGIKHTIECNCILPQYKHKSPTVFHKFVVFSVLNKKDEIIEDYAQCNNCGIIHKIIDICKSKILTGQESISSTISIDDIKLMIPTDLSSVLESYSCDLPNWQHAHFIYSNQLWGERIILTRELLEEEARGKILLFEAHNKFKIEPFVESLVLK